MCIRDRCEVSVPRIAAQDLASATLAVFVRPPVAIIRHESGGPDPRRFYVCQDIWVLPSSSLKSSRATYLLRQRLISRGDLPSARRRAAYAMVGGWHLRRVRTMV